MILSTALLNLALDKESDSGNLASIVSENYSQYECKITYSRSQLGDVYQRVKKLHPVAYVDALRAASRRVRR